jgi:hypothetical protein
VHPRPRRSPRRSRHRAARSTKDLTAGTAETTAGVPCYGDGTSGTRVQAVYARASDKADRYADVVGLIRQWAGTTDRTLADSAAETGGTRHVRWVTDPACNLGVEQVQLSPTGEDSFSATSAELQSLGFDRTDRPYLLWVDANGATTGQRQQRRPQLRPFRYRMLGQGNSVEAHELMHNLGGVQLSAPHTTGGWHCTDGDDRTCYADSSGVTVTRLCGDAPRGSSTALTTTTFTLRRRRKLSRVHWNSAESGFLEGTEPAQTTTTTAALPTTTTTTTVPPPPRPGDLLRHPHQEAAPEEL